MSTTTIEELTPIVGTETESAVVSNAGQRVRESKRKFLRNVVRSHEFAAMMKNRGPLVHNEIADHEGRTDNPYITSALTNGDPSLDGMTHLIAQANQILQYPLQLGSAPGGPGELFSEADLLHEFEKQANALRVRKGYRIRIDALRVAAELEGFEIPRDSEDDFWRFINDTPFWRRANLVLRPSGNLRLVWTGPGESQVGIEFLGNQTVQYVIFKDHLDRRGLIPLADRATFDWVKGKIEEVALTPR